MSLPTGILASTTQLDPGESAEQGTETAKPKTRTWKKQPVEKAAAVVDDMKLYLTADVRYRLRMKAFKEGKKISAVANELLDKNLPTYTVEETPAK
jgi:hypothetical protein